MKYVTNTVGGGDNNFQLCEAKKKKIVGSHFEDFIEKRWFEMDVKDPQMANSSRLSQSGSTAWKGAQGPESVC